MSTKTFTSEETRLAKNTQIAAASTATCVCGVVIPHSLYARWFVCPVCGYRAPRDVHAAQNIIRFGGGMIMKPAKCGEAPVEVASDSSEQLPVKQGTDGAENLGVEASGASSQT